MAYTQQHYQAVAALLAAEREQNGASPALNRIITAFARLFAEDSPRFNRELFGQAARGHVAPTARPRRRQPAARSDRSEHTRRFDGQAVTHSYPGGSVNHGHYKHPEDGWTLPVIIETSQESPS